MNEKRRDCEIYEDYSICRTYDKIREGEFKTFSPHYFCEGDKKKKIIVLIQYYIEEILRLTPEEALNNLTIKDIERDKLKCLLKYVKKVKPIEFENDNSYVKHLVYYAYPSLKKPSLKELTINCYKEVLEGERRNFPKNYFRSPEGELRGKICFEYLCYDILKIKYKDIPSLFLESNDKGLDILKKYKLKILIQMLYYSVSDMIQNMYPEIFK